MLKRNIQIIKDYFELIQFKNMYLILFIFFNIISTIVSLFIPILASLIIERVTIESYYIAYLLIILLSIVYLIHNMFLLGDYWSYAYFFKKTYIYLHSKLIDKIYILNEELPKDISTGKIINSSNLDIINVSEIPSYIFKMLIQTIKLIIILFIFFKQNIFIGFYVLLISLIYVYFANYCNTQSAKYFQKQRKSADKLTGLLSQILKGLKDIKSFNLIDKINNQFDKYRNEWQFNYYSKRKYYFLQQTLVVFITQFGKIILYIFLIILITSNKISLTIFLLLISYYDKVKLSIEDIMNCNMTIIEKSVSLYRIKEIIELKKNNLDIKGNINKNNIMGNIKFKNVYFKYDKIPILKNISFEINKNEITTIVGKTGAGKTTILNLLLKLYKQQKGKILIDNINIYNYENSIYNSYISVVNQKSFIFNTSIRKNLSLIEKNEERQIDACKKVGIHDFIMSLPNGYNTILKEDAINISGGQKQLISLARALLTNSKIILLDEITSSLDPKTTTHIINLLNTLKINHTLILVSHNKNIMINSDKIIVLNKGIIAGIGNHKNLIKNNDIYIELFSNDKF